MSDVPTKFCHACGETIDSRAEICPRCGVRQHALVHGAGTDPVLQEASSKKIAAGLCGIFVGSLGIHEYVLGMTTPATIMLLVTVLSCGLGGIVMGAVGLAEGVLYLTKTDEEFYETYIVGQKEWF